MIILFVFYTFFPIFLKYIIRFIFLNMICLFYG